MQLSWIRVKQVLLGFVFVTLVAVIATAVLLGLDQGKAEQMPNHEINHLRVLEDEDGTLQASDLLPLNATTDELYDKWQDQDGPSLAKGQSGSVWWVLLESPAPDLYLSIFNPTVESVTVYTSGTGAADTTLALSSDHPSEGHVLQAGWGSPSDDSEHFIYPVFAISNQGPVLIRLYSRYVQSYTFSWHYAHSFYSQRSWTTTLLGFFVGILTAVMLFNFLSYRKTKDTMLLTFMIFILSVIVHQMAILGAVQLLLPNKANELIKYVGVLGGLMSLAGALLADSFLRQTRMARASRLVVLFSVASLLSATILTWFNQIQLVNNVTNATPMIVIPATIAFLLSLPRADQVRSRYFTSAWIIMFLAIVVHYLRIQGLVPNTLGSLSLTIVLIVLESFVLATGLAAQTAVYKNQAQAHELAFLRTQIQPHFLFNTLNVLAALAPIDGKKTRGLILDFASYLRTSFDFKALSQDVTLENELEAIEAYARISQARFENRIQFDFEIEDVGPLRIPNLILQPLVENAIRHGLRHKPEGGQIAIRVQRVQNKVRIEVEDNGTGLSAEALERIHQGPDDATGSGVGLYNIRERLRLRFQTELHIENFPGYGAKFWFEIPAERRKRHQEA
ncbi:MAG: histidine kinase [Eubacteriales bacterium]|nr:histidine kinase [Eubacteriales bacterium]